MEKPETEADETAGPAAARAAAMAEETPTGEERDTHPQTPLPPGSEEGKKIPTKERKPRQQREQGNPTEPAPIEAP